MKIHTTSTEYDGIDVNYLSSLSEDELDELLEYLDRGEIDAESFLKPMIINTESMNEEERGYWLAILPSMTIGQSKRLINILITEHNKLSALELKYQKKIKELNEKHLKEWEEHHKNAKKGTA